MAFIDYGSVVKKNGEIIQKDFFMKMKDAVGFRIKSIKRSRKETIWEDSKDYKPHTPKHYDYKMRIEGNYFSYIGDEELLICIRRCGLVFISHGRIIKMINYLNEEYGLPYERQALNFELKGVKFHIKRLFGQSRYKLRFCYKGDLYECLYGYGVDVNKNIWYDVTPRERRYIDNWFKVG